MVLYARGPRGIRHRNTETGLPVAAPAHRLRTDGKKTISYAGVSLSNAADVVFAITYL